MSDTHEPADLLQRPDAFKLSAMQVSIGKLLYTVRIETYMKFMDWKQLFSTSLRSRIAGRNVHRFLQKYVDSPIDSELAAPQAMQSIKLHRFNPNGTLEHKSVAAVFRRLIQYNTSALDGTDLHIRQLLTQYMIIHALGLFHLSYGDIKLLLAATGTRLSGSVIAAILQGTFVPNDLDFYCPRGSADDAMVFMRDVCAYHLSFEASRDYDDVFGIRRVLTLRNASGKQVNIVETYSDYALDVILAFHSTAPRGAISWDRFSHFEINRVRKGVALATPSSMRLAGNTLEGQVQMWRILHKYQGRGFVFEYDHPLPHECGVHIDCPATLRTIDDDGCLHIDLLPSTIPDFKRSSTPVFTWTLAPVGICESGLVRDNAVHSIYSYQYQIFRRLAAALLKMPRPPVNLLEVTPWDDMDYILTFNGDEDDNDQ
ncbi:hypothetical protein R3P38DRAFT_3173208 [Favolaschia claudopus]|uniref:Uncharacterized protein n=1 Tax=Favolaschia claudopus TaxID=2862362 RepID=A0AAW0DGX2_9AGAR